MNNPLLIKLAAVAVGVGAIVASRFVPDASALLIGVGAALFGWVVPAPGAAKPPKPSVDTTNEAGNG